MNASRENICENGVWCVVKMSFRAPTAEFDTCFCKVKGLPKAPAGGRVDLGSQQEETDGHTGSTKQRHGC